MITITYPGQEAKTIFLDDLLAQSSYTLLYFYPKDNTPGCTREAIDFSAKWADFHAKGIQVIGVSQDAHKSHCSFHDKHNLMVPLVSDIDHELHNDERFRTRGEKTMYGKKYMGTVRSTFLLDNQGKVLKEWRNVSVPGHCDEVRDFVIHDIL